MRSCRHPVALLLAVVLLGAGGPLTARTSKASPPSSGVKRAPTPPLGPEVRKALPFADGETLAPADTSAQVPMWPPFYGPPRPPDETNPRVTYLRCHVEGPVVAITFDDGPDPVSTPVLLQVLRERGIKATFFMLGQNATRFPDIVRQVIADGHEVANHSWNHPVLSRMKQSAVLSQLMRTHEILGTVSGQAITLMRPPYGAFTLGQRAWVDKALGYKVILWDVDSLDWQHRNPQKTHDIILRDTRPGSIILCHDIHATTIAAMPQTLDDLKARGFEFLTVSQLVARHHEPAPAASPSVAAAKSKAAPHGEEKADSIPVGGLAVPAVPQ